MGKRLAAERGWGLEPGFKSLLMLQGSQRAKYSSFWARPDQYFTVITANLVLQRDMGHVAAST